MTDRYRQALESLRERCAQEAERITARRRAVAAMSNNEAVKPCGVAAAIRKIDVQQYCEFAVREIERLREDAARYRWLRERWGRITETYDGDSGRITAIGTEPGGEGWDIEPETLDAAIDAAIDDARRAREGG